MTTHSAENICLRSMLVTMIGISTRNRVLRRVVLGVDTSMGKHLTSLETALRQLLSLTEVRRNAALSRAAGMTKVIRSCAKVCIRRSFSQDPKSAFFADNMAGIVNQASAISTECLAPTTSGESAWNALPAASCADLHEGVVRTRSLFDRNIDWEEVLRLADHHGTSSLLYQNLSPLSDVVPPSILSTLRERYESNIRKSLFLTRELIRIGDRLDGLGIEVIPYKGLALSEIYYGATALRQSGDIDLFVRRQDVGRIKEAVRELGYTTRVPISKDAEEDLPRFRIRMHLRQPGRMQRARVAVGAAAALLRRRL
jgi:Uncharacterised nucleotidyltransferase